MEFNYKNSIFVFGSNERGFHGAGAAKFALNYKGAILYQAVGLQGRSYAIPTKDATIKRTLPLNVINNYVDHFKRYAYEHRHMQFQVTRIGCGLAGLKDHQIAPMFMFSPENCWFDDAWKPWLPDAQFWGTH